MTDAKEATLLVLAHNHMVRVVQDSATTLTWVERATDNGTEGSVITLDINERFIQLFQPINATNFAALVTNHELEVTPEGRGFLFTSEPLSQRMLRTLAFSDDRVELHASDVASALGLGQTETHDRLKELFDLGFVALTDTDRGTIAELTSEGEQLMQSP